MKKSFPIIIAVLIWMWPAIFIKVLSSHFDSVTQNFYRYLIASVTLILVNLIFYRKEYISSFRSIHSFFLPSVLLFLFQTTRAEAIYRVMPASSVLIGKLSLLFIIILTFIFFKDERTTIRSRNFIFGWRWTPKVGQPEGQIKLESEFIENVTGIRLPCRTGEANRNRPHPVFGRQGSNDLGHNYTCLSIR